MAALPPKNSAAFTKHQQTFAASVNLPNFLHGGAANHELLAAPVCQAFCLMSPAEKNFRGIFPETRKLASLPAWPLTPTAWVCTSTEGICRVAHDCTEAAGTEGATSTNYGGRNTDNAIVGGRGKG